MEKQALRHKNSKGQALLEYSLVLVLVTLAVVVVLALLGPTIGNTYSNVVTELGTKGNPTSTAVVPTAVPTAVPTPDPSWVYCSEEYQYCSFSGTKEVRYGENGHYVFMTLIGGTWCTNEVFTDPLVGTLKHCYIR